MEIYDYHTAGNKNVIKEYLSALPKIERNVGYHIRHLITSKGLEAIEELDTRQLRGKLWEIKFLKNRIIYIIVDSDRINFLHACQKQKGKAEQFELETAIKRAKEIGYNV